MTVARKYYRDLVEIHVERQYGHEEASHTPHREQLVKMLVSIMEVELALPWQNELPLFGIALWEACRVSSVVSRCAFVRGTLLWVYRRNPTKPNGWYDAAPDEARERLAAAQTALAMGGMRAVRELREATGNRRRRPRKAE